MHKSVFAKVVVSPHGGQMSNILQVLVLVGKWRCNHTSADNISKREKLAQR